MDIKVPKTLDLGSGEFVDVAYLQQVFGVKRRTAIKYLKALHIKPMYIGHDVYFSLPTFKRIMFVLMKPGGRGFIFPGSIQKNNPRTIGNSEYLTEVTPEILAEAANPNILIEMMASEMRDVNAAKKCATIQNEPRPVGRPRKENNGQPT